MKHLRKTLALLLTFAMILPGTPGRVFAEEMYEDPAPDSGAVYAEEVLQNDAAVPVTYALSFYANAEPGTVSDYTMTVQEGQPAKLPDNWYMAPACHVFAGWQIGEQIYQPHDQIILAQSEAVVPRWEDDAAAHVWSVTGWNWAEDNTSAEAILTCTQCGGTQTAPAGVSTEELEDRTVYTAGITIGDAAYSDTREVLKEAAVQEETNREEIAEETSPDGDKDAASGEEKEIALQPEMRSLRAPALRSGDPALQNDTNDTVTAVAKDESGGQYSTLADAVSKNGTNSTVSLLADTASDNIYISRNLTLDLGGKTLTGNVYVFEGAVSVENGTITGALGVYDSANVTLQNNAAVRGQVVVWGDGTFGEGGCKTPVFNVYGSVSNTGDAAITTNGRDRSGPCINIYDGANVCSTDDIAIYQPSGNVNISGGTVSGATAVYQKSGTLTITGGTLTGNGAKADYVYNGSGAHATGDAIVVDSCSYPGGTPVLTVSGSPVISSANAKGIGDYITKDGATPVISSVSDSITLPEGQIWIEQNGTYIIGEGYTVTFDLDGGTGEIPSQKVAKGGTAAKPEDPKNEGKIFDGWYNGEDEFDFASPVNENLTLKAKWAAAVAKDDQDNLYRTLAEAVAAVNSGIVTLLDNASGAGIFVAAKDAKNIVIDLGGFTYTVTGPAVGSARTESQALHLEKGNTIALRNGIVTSTPESGVKMLVQNYSNLTLEGVTLDGTSLPGEKPYTLSNNCGDVLIGNETTIIAKNGGYAFDVCVTNYYPEGTRVTVEDRAVVNGNIQYDVWGKVPAENRTGLTINGGTIYGTFEVEDALKEAAEEKIVINGGAFRDDTGNIYKVPEGMMLYKTDDEAMYTLKEAVTVMFDTDGGSEAPEKQTIAKGTVAVQPADPTKDGVLFGGWYNGEGEFDFASPVNENLILKAKWAAAVAKDDQGRQFITLEKAIESVNEGGTVTLLDDVSVGQARIAKSLTLDLGERSVTGRVTIDSGTVAVKNGMIIGRFDVYDDSRVTLEKDAAVNGPAVVWGDGTAGESGCKTPEFNVYGSVSNTGDVAISTNGTDRSGANINIYDGANVIAKDEIAIYQPSGNVNISGGTITGTTAVYQKSGTLNITGGILHGNGEDKDYVYYGNGANATGDALVIDNCGYPGGSPATAITGGVLVSDHADAVGSYAYKENEPKTGFISGGEFSNVVPEKYCAEGYAPVEDLDGNNLYPVHKHAEHMIRVEAKKATCTEEGANPCWTCEICGKYFEDEAAQNEITESSVIIPPLKHDYVYTVLREATCTKVGVRTGTCSRDSSHTTVEVIPAAGHELEAVAAKDPTYEEDGVRAHYKCKNCGELFMDEEGKEPAEEADVIIPKLTMGLGTVSPITQPGKAEVTGGGEETVSVNYSGLELSFSKADPSIGRMIDADWTGFNVVAPKEVTKEYLQDHEVSYSNDGGKTKKSFNRNNDGTIKKGEHAGRYRLECWVPLVAEEVEAKVAGGETVADWTYKFDWDGDGEYEQTLLVKIDLANISLKGEDGEVAVRIEDGNVKVHSKLTHVEAADAKCTEAGNSEYWVCEICGEYFSDEKAENKIEENSWIIPAKDHTPGKPVIENKVASTCAKEGSYDKVVYCTECTQELRREKVSTPVSDTHDWNDWVVLVDATCSGKGVRYRVCKEKALHQEIEVIPATGKHDLLAVSKVPATCTAAGTEAYYKCSYCGKLFSDAAGRKEIASPASVKPLGHSWSTPVWTWSSDHSIAIARFTCSVCGETKTDIATVKQAVTPAKPGVAGKTDYTAAVTEKGRTYTDTKTAAIPALKTPDVSYRTHVQTYGWQGYVKNGEMSGTEGKSKRLEGINIKLDNLPYSGSVVYRTHVQTFGWQGWKKDGEMSGTEGKAKRLEGIQIYLTGELAKYYDIYYRVHAQTFGWLDWAKNGVMAGTSGLSKRLEGINIVLVPKGGKAPGSMARSSVCGNGTTLPENPYKEP